jgi:hypothetical protein
MNIDSPLCSENLAEQIAKECVRTKVKWIVYDNNTKTVSTEERGVSFTTKHIMTIGYLKHNQGKCSFNNLSAYYEKKRRKAKQPIVLQQAFHISLTLDKLYQTKKDFEEKYKTELSANESDRSNSRNEESMILKAAILQRRYSKLWNCNIIPSFLLMQIAASIDAKYQNSPEVDFEKIDLGTLDLSPEVSNALFGIRKVDKKHECSLHNLQTTK